MNKELKEQAKQYFETNLLDGDKMEDCGKAVITIDQDFIEVFDSLIDKTVQMTEEMIVEDMLKVFSDNAKIYGGMRGEFNASAILCIKDYCEAKGIITNKNDINNNKE